MEKSVAQKVRRSREQEINGAEIILHRRKGAHSRSRSGAKPAHTALLACARRNHLHRGPQSWTDVRSRRRGHSASRNGVRGQGSLAPLLAHGPHCRQIDRPTDRPTSRPVGTHDVKYNESSIDCCRLGYRSCAAHLNSSTCIKLRHMSTFIGS